MSMTGLILDLLVYTHITRSLGRTVHFWGAVDVKSSAKKHFIHSRAKI